MIDIRNQIIAGIALALILAMFAWLWRAIGTKASPHVRQWLTENVAYARSGFRLHAVLYGDRETSIAQAVISKVIPSPSADAQFSRMRTLRSHPFQRRKSFAWQVYVAFVPFCAANGWRQLEIVGWTAPGLIAPWTKQWTIMFDGGKLVIGPGWSPIQPIESFKAKPITITIQTTNNWPPHRDTTSDY